MNSALISDCGTYRYQLRRSWDTFTGAGTVLWVMLNPSTADADNDDPTITRCIGYAKAWGYAGIAVGNLYAYRATKPADLWDAAGNVDIYGPDNEEHLVSMAREASLVIAAWGANNCVPGAHHVMQLLNPYASLYCIGTTKDGYPMHPLYKPKDLKPVMYSQSAKACE